MYCCHPKLINTGRTALVKCKTTGKYRQRPIMACPDCGKEGTFKDFTRSISWNKSDEVWTQ